jgi:uncharacterized protein (TIGR02246 family)
MKNCITTMLALLTISHVSLSVHADEAAVRQTLSDYVGVFNAKAADKVAEFWTENGTHTDRETGQRTVGRDAIQADMAKVLSELSDTKLSATVDSVRFITPDVARVEGETMLSTIGIEPIVSGFSAIVVRQNDKWLIDSIEEMTLPEPESAADALQELDWLIGKWVDESDDVQVTTTFRWTAGQAFLLRSFDIESRDGITMTGTQVIGWDARQHQIRGWSFNSDGSFGESTWSGDGDSWLCKSVQTLATGATASGTYVMERQDENSFTIQLIGHEFEGEPEPAREPIRVVRVQEESEADISPRN